MASYPTSVKTFTSKSDGSGNKIFASHINDLQDEVHAIEDGLLNGTAPVNSSRITAPALSVSAGSTLTTLSVTGASTFAGAVSMPAAEAIRLELDASLQFASNSTTAVPWTLHIFATNSSMHSTATNPTQVAPQSTGIFRCTAALTFNGGLSSAYQLTIEDSSGGIVGYASLGLASTAIGIPPTVMASGIKYIDTLAANPWLRVVIKAVGSTNSLDNASGRTSFTVVKDR